MKIEFLKEIEIDEKGEDQIFYWVKIDDTNANPTRCFLDKEKAEIYYEAMKKYYLKYGAYKKITETLKSEEVFFTTEKK